MQLHIETITQQASLFIDPEVKPEFSPPLPEVKPQNITFHTESQKLLAITPQNQPKTLADILYQPTIMEIFLKYVSPVTLMRLNTSCYQVVMQKISRTYAESRARRALALHSFSLATAPMVCRDILYTAVAAITENGLEYQYLDPRLQNDVGIVKIALVSIAQKDDKDTYKKYTLLFPDHIQIKLAEYVHALKITSGESLFDQTFQTENRCLRYHEFLAKAYIHKFPHDVDICRIMLQIFGCLVGYTSKELRDDPKIVMIAVKQNASSLIYANPIFRDNDELVLTAVTQKGLVLSSASSRLQNREDIVMVAVTQEGTALEDASERLRDKEDIVMAAVTQDGTALEFASSRLQDSDEIVMTAMQQDEKALEFASERVRKTMQRHSEQSMILYLFSLLKSALFGL